MIFLPPHFQDLKGYLKDHVITVVNKDTRKKIVGTYKKIKTNSNKKKIFISAAIVVKEVTHLITVLREKMIWDIDKTMRQPVMKIKVLSVLK